MCGTGLAALLLHPGTHLFARGRGPLGGSSALVVGVAFATLLGGVALRERYVRQVGARRELDPVEQRLADGVGRVLTAAPLALPVLILVLYRFDPSDDSPQTGRPPVVLPPAAPQTAEQPDHGLDVWATRIVLGLCVAVLAVVAVAAGVYLWRYLTRPPAPGARVTSYQAGDDDHERLARAADSGRRALHDGTDARAAVIACYVAMEESLAGSGTARRTSDSPQDLLERAVADGLPATAAAELTALFREARYSTHPMDAGHRHRAGAALAEIAHDLRARRSGAAAGAS